MLHIIQVVEYTLKPRPLLHQNSIALSWPSSSSSSLLPKQLFLFLALAYRLQRLRGRQVGVCWGWIWVLSGS